VSGAAGPSAAGFADRARDRCVEPAPTSIGSATAAGIGRGASRPRIAAAFGARRVRATAGSTRAGRAGSGRSAAAPVTEPPFRHAGGRGSSGGDDAPPPLQPAARRRNSRLRRVDVDSSWNRSPRAIIA